jgi:DNA phosphorothioation-dependent restriction protein DptG
MENLQVIELYGYIYDADVAVKAEKLFQTAQRTNPQFFGVLLIKGP